MADTAIIWKTAEGLKDKAEAIYANLESDGDLVALNNGLANLRDQAEELRSVVSRVDDILAEL